MFTFWKPKVRKDPLPAERGGENPEGDRWIDVPGMIRQASRLVRVGQLLRKGKREIPLLSREKIDSLISRALKSVIARYRAAGVSESPASPKEMEADYRREFQDLLSQHQETQRAGEELAQSKQALDLELREMRTDLAQQRALADGRLPKEIEKAMLESRFAQLYTHLDAMDRALGTLFSSKLYTYRQLQTLLRQAVAARKAAAVKARNAPLRKALQLAREMPRVAAEPADAVEQGASRRVSFDMMTMEPGRGLDVGTANICAAARRTSTGETLYNVQRNVFLDVRDDEFSRRILKFGIDYVVRGERGFVIGDPAFELANVFEKQTRRPMRAGMISSEEPEAVPVVAYLVAQLLGLPQQEGEICVFSLPGDPTDVNDTFLYHRSALETAIADLGYTPRPMLDGHVIVSAELQDQEYTGIVVSCGGGTVNVCVAYKGVPAFVFSTQRGGDWIDSSAATALGMPVPLVCAVKENGMDLRNPQGRVQQAIAIYARNFIQYTLQAMMQKMNEADRMPNFTKEIHLVCAGGTSMIRGFVDVFREEFDKMDFPVGVSTIRLAANPLRAVAAGCLQAAIEETRARNEPSLKASPGALERAAISGIPKKAREAPIPLVHS